MRSKKKYQPKKDRNRLRSHIFEKNKHPQPIPLLPKSHHIFNNTHVLMVLNEGTE